MNKKRINQPFFLTNTSIVVSFLLLQSVMASPVDNEKEQPNCEKQCNVEETGRIPNDSQVIQTAVTKNSEQVLNRKHFVLHGLTDLKSTETSTQEPISGSLSRENDTTIRFVSGKHFITESTRNEIELILNKLSDKNNLKLHFIGHADSQRLSANARKFYRDNQELSEDRANIVADYFKKELQLSDNAITTEGKSNRVPVASNATLKGMAMNRRVEVIATYFEPIPEPVISKQGICAGQLQITQGMRVTVDGKPFSVIDGVNNADEQRCADVALEKIEFQLQYDNLNSSPLLNINHALVKNENNYELRIQGYSNYLYFINKAELRIFEGESQKTLTVVELDNDLQARWTVPESYLDKSLTYRLRVYDGQKHFDETLQLPLSFKTVTKLNADTLKSTLLAGYGQSKLSTQTIPVNGGSLTINGKNIPSDHNVYFLARKIPVSSNQDFVHQQIVPNAVHRVEVAVLDNNGDGQLIYRDLELKQDDWFYVGLADMTFGENSTNGPIKLLTGDEQHFEGDLFVDGRLAFYAKGKWQDDYTVTASVDTREEPLSELLSNFSAKDPNSLFRRLEEENHYSVYGDDSTLIEDAPTKGKVYLKIEDSQSHAVWGNFHTKFDQTELTRLARGLYGAQLDWNSEKVTSFGERISEIDLFIAEADTSSSYEKHRGTGGSLYYLQHQDITQGSERVSIELRDKDSGLVLSSTYLMAGADYDIDSLQGRILLAKPLSSTSDDGLLIRDSGISGHHAYLVINYEYTPGFEALEDMTYGGRLSHWFGDNLKIGLTASSQDMGDEKQKLLGLDLTYVHSDESYIKLEVAQSDGLASSAENSNNGGYHFDPIQSVITPKKSSAFRFETGFSLTDLGFDEQGIAQFYLNKKEAGYSGLGQLTQFETDQVGTNLQWNVTEDSSLRLKMDNKEEDGGIDQQSAELDFLYQLNSNWTMTVGIRNNKTIPTTTAQSVNTGERTDLGVQLDYEPQKTLKETEQEQSEQEQSEEQISNDWSVFVFAQQTLDNKDNRAENDRFGLGGRYQVNEKLDILGEISTGNLGFGSEVGIDYQYTDASNVYVNYELDPDRTGNGLSGRNGQLVGGTRHRFSDSTSVYGEERYQHGDSSSGLTHAYGIDYTPNDRWTLGLALENGKMQQPGQEDIQRQAVAFNGGYAADNFKYGGALEYREDKKTSENRKSWLFRNNFNYQVNPDWRTQLRVDVAISDSNNGNHYNSDFTEALLGFAYRPVLNDRFNMLLTYNFLEDLAPSQQFTSSGTLNDYQQRSHVFAVDANYDLTEQWEIGGKYARREGEMRAGRDTGTWYSSTSELYIVRADWHLVKNWDFLIEARELRIVAAEEKRLGALLVLHRHFGEHLKLGVGYNFTDFSDDLTDLDYDAKGWFINIVGKF